MNLISNLFKYRREYCLIVEEIGAYFEATYARIDTINKKIFLLKKKKLKNLNKLKKPLFPLDKLIIALSSAQATTIESLVHLRRPRPQEAISEAELDHLIFRGLWEFLNHYRGWAAKKMAVADLDLVLANIEIRDVGLGTHRVFNPLGFKGEDFFLKFRGTFIPRRLLGFVTSLSSWTKYLGVVEDAGIVSATIPEPTDFVVHAGEAKTVVFSHEEERLHVKEIPWGLMNILGAINQALAVEDEAAREILERYLKNKVSKRFERLIQSAISEQFKTLLGSLVSLYNKSKHKTRPTIHFNFRFAIRPPESLFQSSKMRMVNFSKWLEFQGFTIHAKYDKSFSSRADQNTLALLIHPYHYPHYDFLNQLLRRRAKWLIAHP